MREVNGSPLTRAKIELHSMFISCPAFNWSLISFDEFVASGGVSFICVVHSWNKSMLWNSITINYRKYINCIRVRLGFLSRQFCCISYHHYDEMIAWHFSDIYKNLKDGKLSQLLLLMSKLINVKHFPPQMTLNVYDEREKKFFLSSFRINNRF